MNNVTMCTYWLACQQGFLDVETAGKEILRFVSQDYKKEHKLTERPQKASRMAKNIFNGLAEKDFVRVIHTRRIRTLGQVPYICPRIHILGLSFLPEFRSHTEFNSLVSSLRWLRKHAFPESRKRRKERVKKEMRKLMARSRKREEGNIKIEFPRARVTDALIRLQDEILKNPNKWPTAAWKGMHEKSTKHKHETEKKKRTRLAWRYAPRAFPSKDSTDQENA